MDNYKYTTDGKKVVIIGNLNSQEKIVQEIFIIDGKEIPSGENFVVKSLHDNPAISWKENETKRIKEQYETTRNEYDRRINDLKASHERLKNELSEKNKYLKKYINNVTHESFDLLTKFLKGEIKYLVNDNYDPEITEFKNMNCDYDRDKLKLISFYGKDDGTLSVGISNYSDGSGSVDYFYPFTNKKHAIQKLKEIISSKKRLNSYIVETAKEYNIKLDSKILEEYYNDRIESLNKTIEREEKTLKNKKKELKEVLKDKQNKA